MTATTAAPPQTDQQTSEMRRLVAGIIRAQGNSFIKELLRSLDIPLGATKDAFEKNLMAAIDDGILTIDHIEEWSNRVEGWGNQHIYLYRLTPSLLRSLTTGKIQKAVKAAGYERVWDKKTILEYPEDPELTSISWHNNVLRIVWQEATPGWTPVKEKNYIAIEGLDTYEYRAYRLLERRAFTRFEADKSLGLAALFIADPITGPEHQKSIDEAKAVIAQLLNLQSLEDAQLDMAIVSRTIDQKNVPTIKTPNPPIKTQRSKLASGGAYVEFAANDANASYASTPAVNDVRKSIKPAQLKKFKGSNGVFWFEPSVGKRRPLADRRRVELHGRDKRIRVRAQMERHEIWTILETISRY